MFLLFLKTNKCGWNRFPLLVFVSERTQRCALKIGWSFFFFFFFAAYSRRLLSVRKGALRGGTTGDNPDRRRVRSQHVLLRSADERGVSRRRISWGQPGSEPSGGAGWTACLRSSSRTAWAGPAGSRRTNGYKLLFSFSSYLEPFSGGNGDAPAGQVRVREQSQDH